MRTVGDLKRNEEFIHNGYRYFFIGIVQRQGRYVAQVMSETGIPYLVELDREIEA